MELLFKQFERNSLSSNADNHFHALKLLFEILEILERGDTRSELTKELSRLSEYYTQLSKSPDVDPHKLENFLKQVNQLYLWVVNYQGKFGDQVRKNPFIESVKLRASIPGGTSSFDCPDLTLFLNLQAKQRQQKLNEWLENIKGIKTSIQVILRMLRESGQWENNEAPLGSFMINSSDRPIQLLRVRLNSEPEVFPEFSCGKHRSNIHFMKFNENHRKVAIQRPIQFELACCQ